MNFTDRYSRQVLFTPIGREGQERLGRSRALVVGCGALGSGILDSLARAGVGTIRFVDRDFVELSNLQRQMLYTEADARERLPKAVAAKNALVRINSTLVYDARVADFNQGNAEALAEGMDLILDGTDNFEARFLMNEVAVKHHLPYIYGACVAATGTCMAIIPGRTPCLRCIVPVPPERGQMPTCDTVGVIGPVVRMVAAQECALALRILTAGRESFPPFLIQTDSWESEFLRVDMSGARWPECPVCALGDFTALAGAGASQAVSLCGRNMVQIVFSPPPAGNPPAIDFEALSRRLAPLGQTCWNGYLLTFSVPPHELILFLDGRCLVKGTTDPAEARGLYAKYFGM